MTSTWLGDDADDRRRSNWLSDAVQPELSLTSAEHNDTARAASGRATDTPIPPPTITNDFAWTDKLPCLTFSTR